MEEMEEREEIEETEEAEGIGRDVVSTASTAMEVEVTVIEN